MHLSIFANDLLQQSLALLVAVELLLLYVSGKIHIYIFKILYLPHLIWRSSNMQTGFAIIYLKTSEVGDNITQLRLFLT